MTIIPALFSQVTDHRLHWWSRCFKITLATLDNTIFRFTDHAEPLVLFDEGVYLAQDGMESSALERKSGTDDSNKSGRGIISDSAITYDLLESGAFHGAQVDEYLVDWRVPFVGPIDHIRYFIRETSFDGATWTADLTGITSLLVKPVGDIWGPVCRVPLFSKGVGKCELSSTPFRETGSVNTLIDPRRSFSWIVTNPLWLSPGYGDDGLVTFTSGNLDGFVGNIKSHSPLAPGELIITMQERTPSVITVGNNVSMKPGCDHTLLGDCSLKFANGINYQGEPFIPGGDTARRGVSLLQGTDDSDCP